VNCESSETVGIFRGFIRMSVRAFELVPAIERVNLLSEKASSNIVMRHVISGCACFVCIIL